MADNIISIIPSSSCFKVNRSLKPGQRKFSAERRTWTWRL